MMTYVLRETFFTIHTYGMWLRAVMHLNGMTLYGIQQLVDSRESDDRCAQRLDDRVGGCRGNRRMPPQSVEQIGRALLAQSF